MTPDPEGYDKLRQVLGELSFLDYILALPLSSAEGFARFSLRVLEVLAWRVLCRQSIHHIRVLCECRL